MRMLNLSSYVNLTNLRHGHETLAIHTAVLHKIDNDLKSTWKIIWWVYGTSWEVGSLLMNW